MHACPAANATAMQADSEVETTTHHHYFLIFQADYCPRSAADRRYHASHTLQESSPGTKPSASASAAIKRRPGRSSIDKQVASYISALILGCAHQLLCVPPSSNRFHLCRVPSRACTYRAWRASSSPRSRRGSSSPPPPSPRRGRPSSTPSSRTRRTTSPASAWRTTPPLPGAASRMVGLLRRRRQLRWRAAATPEPAGLYGAAAGAHQSHIVEVKLSCVRSG